METPADRFMNELRNVIADAEDLLRATADQTGPKVQEVRARAEESLRNAKEHLQGAGKQLDVHVRENPWAAVGIAAGIGLVVGILMARK
jgi:ElaB/YqjD/DUF883 family membrane-anchored ribosome-binding protein